MELRQFMEIAGSYGIFCALFVWLLLYQLKQNRDTVDRYERREKEIITRNEAREKELFAIINDYKAELQRLADTVEKIWLMLDKRA